MHADVYNVPEELLYRALVFVLISVCDPEIFTDSDATSFRIKTLTMRKQGFEVKKK